MFGNKSQNAAKVRKNIRKINHELEMLDYARQVSGSRNKATAVAVKLSRAAGFNYDNYLYAVNMFRELVARFQGKLFVLSNRDLVFTYHGPPGEPAVKDAVFKIRLLFNVGGDDATTGSFADWYDLEFDSEPFVDYARRVYDRHKPDGGAEAAMPAATEPDPDPEDTPAEAGGEALADALGEFTRLLAGSDLTSMLRRQPVYEVTHEHGARVFVHEIYVSIADLERKLPPGISLTSDRYLFQYAMHALDKRVLQVMKQQMQYLPSGNFTLNANVATLLSKEFAEFDAVLDATARASIVLELPAVDVMGDLATFLAVADSVRHKGYSLCLDGLSPFTMPYFRLQDLSFDLFKIAWSPDLQERDGQQVTLLQGVVDRCGAERMILYHCDSEHAVRFGQDFGISLYQGRFLDQVVAGG